MPVSDYTLNQMRDRDTSPRVAEGKTPSNAPPVADKATAQAQPKPDSSHLMETDVPITGTNQKEVLGSNPRPLSPKQPGLPSDHYVP